MDFVILLVSLIFVLFTIFIVNRSFVNTVKQSQKEIIESITDGVVCVDEHNKIVLFNTALEKIIGLQKQPALGQSVDTVIQVYDGQTVVPFAIYSQGIENSTKTGLKLHFNKEEVPFSLTITRFKLGNKKKVSLVTFRNLSQEHQLEEMKIDFVSMAGHELRTPLTAIRGYASLLQMHYATHLEPSAKELLTRLIVSTTNLANLIDNLLSVSRIERNSMIIDTKPLDLTIIIKDIFESFKQQASTRQQKFTLNIPERLPIVMADPFRIGQVFINLIGNAINYTQEGGAIIVNVAEKNDSLEVSIQDNGEGIPKEALPRLFTKFFRVSGSLEQGSKGTGLGLYITKSIIEMHKGKIWAASEPGKGSTFTFSLPIATKDQVTQHQENTGQAFLTVKNGQGIIVKKMT